MPVLLAALVVGALLGLLGSGGSIVTVPILTYVVGQEEKVAIAGSLAVVGAISAAGGLAHARAGRVSWPLVVLFGLPGMAGTYLGAWLSSGVSADVQMSLLAGTMLAAAVLLGRRRSAPESTARPRGARVLWIALEGVAVGVLTGLVGVGGGFLIVPALVLLGGLPMPRAVGTSLVIIALKSASGFFKYTRVLEDADLHLEWGVLASFALAGIVGSFAGQRLGRRVPPALLQRVFAFLLVAVAAWVTYATWS